MKLSKFNEDKWFGIETMSELSIGVIVVITSVSAILSLHQLPLPV